MNQESKLNNMIKVSSGITGLDEMLNGGFPSNKIILFRGGPGTGKTISCLQFILEGAKKEEKGICITLDEPCAFSLSKDIWIISVSVGLQV
jgi:circadian clock protein KaiC